MGQSFSIGSLLPLRFRLWLGKLLFPPFHAGKASRVSWHRVIKGPCDPPEIEAMQYIASHTTIPIPKLYGIHTMGGSIFIEMEYIRGDTLDSSWRHLSATQRQDVAIDLKRHLVSLRELEPPMQDIVCSALQNPTYDCRIGERFFGPMNHDEFHSLTRKNLVVEDIHFLGEDVTATHLHRHYQTCFTHADLAPRNILVRNGRVVAIIDWGFAGWYPEYWEFTKAHYSFLGRDYWEDLVRLCLQPYESELEGERTLWRMLPDPGSRQSHTYADGTTAFFKGSDPSAAWLETRADQPPDLWSVSLAARP